MEARADVHATEELPAVAEPGLAMGRYRLGARLGAGGFGTVYAAPRRAPRPAGRGQGRSRPTGRRRSAPSARRAPSPGSTTRRSSRCSTPASEDGCRYLVSELVEGRTLAQLEADGALSDRDVLRIGLALSDALAHAHERGVIHRDVKPQNVIVPDAPSSRRGAAKLTDFGVAHLAGEDALTRTGDVVGTLAYMAPEQAAGRRGRRARRPLRARRSCSTRRSRASTRSAAGSPAATARRIGTRLPPLRAPAARDLPAELCAAIDRAILRRSRASAATLDDLFDALADALPEVSDEGGPIAPHPLERRLPGAAARRSAGSSRPPRPAALACAALAGLTPEPAVAPRARRRRARPRSSRVLPRVGLARVGRGRDGARAGARARAAAGRGAAGRCARASRPPLLLRADGRAWSLPAAAPLLGLARPRRRLPGARRPRAALAPAAALGALGAWWLVLGRAAARARARLRPGRRHARRGDASTGRRASPPAT